MQLWRTILLFAKRRIDQARRGELAATGLLPSAWGSGGPARRLNRAAPICENPVRILAVVRLRPGQVTLAVERVNAWLLENKRLGLCYGRLGVIVESLLQAACVLLIAPRLAQEF